MIILKRRYINKIMLLIHIFQICGIFNSKKSLYFAYLFKLNFYLNYFIQKNDSIKSNTNTFVLSKYK